MSDTYIATCVKEVESIVCKSFLLTKWENLTCLYVANEIDFIRDKRPSLLVSEIKFDKVGASILIADRYG